MNRISVFIFGMLVGINAGWAQVATDGSLPGTTATVLPGPDFVITDSLGNQVGANLFHSFDVFSINDTQSATFNTGFTGTTNNVINRVTGLLSGLSPTAIDGLITSNIASADFWFINPAGVTIGDNGAINVPAGLYISTADFLVLGDCATPVDCGSYNATNPGNTTLTIANPTAFGFLDATIGTISVTDATFGNGNGALSFVGGDLDFTDSSVWTIGYDFDMVSAGGAGTIAVDPEAATGTTVTQYGTATIDDGNVRTVAGGLFFIRGRELVLTNYA